MLVQIKQFPYYEIEDNIKYKTYRAIVTQTGTNDPVATVLQNTLGETITWNRQGPGDYNLVKTGGWGNTEKIFATAYNVTADQAVRSAPPLYWASDTIYKLLTYYNASQADGQLNRGMIEIIIYE